MLRKILVFCGLQDFSVISLGLVAYSFEDVAIMNLKLAGTATCRNWQINPLRDMTHMSKAILRALSERTASVT